MAEAAGDTSDSSLVESMDAQLRDLYVDRERLADAIGPLSADDIIELIESMRAQLDALYAERDESDGSA